MTIIVGTELQLSGLLTVPSVLFLFFLESEKISTKNQLPVSKRPLVEWFLRQLFFLSIARLLVIPTYSHRPSRPMMKLAIKPIHPWIISERLGHSWNSLFLRPLDFGQISTPSFLLGGK